MHFISSSFIIIYFLYILIKQIVTKKNLDNKLIPGAYVLTFLLVGLAITYSNTTRFLNPFEGKFLHTLINIFIHVGSILVIIVSLAINKNDVSDFKEFWQKIKRKY